MYCPTLKDRTEIRFDGRKGVFFRGQIEFATVVGNCATFPAALVDSAASRFAILACASDWRPIGGGSSHCLFTFRVYNWRLANKPSEIADSALTTVAQIAALLEELAPPRLAEEWDNVGLLVGDKNREVEKLMTCLTVTPAVAAEAVEQGADLIVAHHPIPFVATKRLTSDTTVGRLLLELMAARIAVYSGHTAFDSAGEGINQLLAEGLELREIVPLTPHPEGQGTGRWGRLDEPVPLGDLAGRLKRFLRIERVQIVGRIGHLVRAAAIGCGAADELLAAAVANDCDAMVLGEARFHTCLEAEARGISLLLPGHFASERFALERLAGAIAARFPKLNVWASRSERDPLQWG
ncbi:MAG: Nif3-like dinuclear metal center hexameric protein [Pirellulales bacterium]|nr:Nif3-like dinuclear metal center hexameric protein [Pirellulales bacterium]